MYFIKKAAAILSISERTVRDWMKQCGLKIKILETDRRRAYITDGDMDTLADHVYSKIKKKEAKRKKQAGGKTEVLDDNEYKYYHENKEGKLYSLLGAASFLDVSINTVKSWITTHDIGAELIVTDKKRLYISHADVLLLADLHGRKGVKKRYADVTIRREENNAREGEKEFYSVAEAALPLNVSEVSVKRWIRQHSIGKNIQATDRKRVYIAHKDILMLADLHNRKLVSNPSSADVIEEIKKLRSKVLKIASEIEDIKHDFRLFVKRSILIG